MRSQLSPLEHRLRQFVVRRVVPSTIEGSLRVFNLFETRMRRTTAITRYVSGRGIEVGAAATPAAVPRAVRVTYVDKYSADALRADPELAGLDIVEPEVLNSAETLESFADSSLDFVLGFSMMEHVQNPIGTLRTFCRVLKPGGVFVISAPDKRYYTPDQNRPLTTWEHLVRDDVEGPEVSREAHFREAGARELSGRALDDFVAHAMANDAHTHFHVWDANTFAEFVLQSRRYLDDAFDLVEFASYGHEVLCVGRRA